ncbi:MAG: DUF4340 domain-containing protein [Gammaproteobacteria bacterium]|nr:DUF4340 domain-containing protein [Gammaproteobacteria bacterium]
MQDYKTKIKSIIQQLDSRSWLNIGMLLFILLLILLAFIEPGEKDTKQIVTLTNLKQADIKQIEIRRSNDEDITLRHKNDIWYMSSPYQLPANDFRAQSASALAEIKSHLQYNVSNINLKEFKLDKPEITIILNDMVTLEIGGVDPINNRRYVKNGDTLHLVSNTFYYQLKGQITTYISYQIIPPETEITKLILPKLTLTLESGNWKLHPAQEDISADRINEFLDEWQHAQSLEISKYTGRKRKNDIQIYYKDQLQPIGFSLMKKQDSIFLVRNDLGISYKLSDEIAEKLQKLPDPPEPPESSTTPSTDGNTAAPD